PLTNDVQLAFKLPLIEDIAGDEHLPHKRLGAARHHTDHIAFDGHIAPPKKPSALLTDDSRKEFLTLLSRIDLRREEHHPNAIFPCMGQQHPRITGRTREKLMRHLKQN